LEDLRQSDPIKRNNVIEMLRENATNAPAILLTVARHRPFITRSLPIAILSRLPTSISRHLPNPSAAIRTRVDCIRVIGLVGRFSSNAVPALVEIMNRDSIEVSSAARVTLGQIGAPAVPSLVEALNDQNSPRRSEAAWALRDIGSPASNAIPALVKAAHNGNSSTVLAAVSALGAMGPIAAGPLAQCLDVSGEVEQALAADSLARLGNSATQALPTLHKLVRSPSLKVSQAAARAVEAIDSSGTPPPTIGHE